ncbi:unnamed protein product [Lampetra fluviatilis]
MNPAAGLSACTSECRCCSACTSAMRSERRIFVRGLRVMSPARLRGGEVSGGDMERRREEDEDAMMWRRWEEEEL